MSTAADAVESAAYVDVGSERLYTVSHAARGERRGGVLLVPPFGSERMNGYVSLVNWARRLASSGFDVLRFDYRGTGESTGRFEAIDLSIWIEDIEHMEGVLKKTLGGQPLVLHGVRLGGLLAAAVFRAGRGDALLMWNPLDSARKMLMEVLRGKLLEDMALGITRERKTRDAYIAELEAGQIVEVEGQPWSRELWQSAADLALVLPDASDTRPWKRVELVRNPKTRSTEPSAPWKIPVPMPLFWRNKQTLVPDLSDLFECNIEWLLETTKESARR